jgi:PilZ domain-containing protein
MQQQYAVQRRFQRHVFTASVEVRRKPPHDNGPIPGLTMEISESGFSTMLGNELMVGERVITVFALPTAGRLTIEAVVRNKNLFRYGFEFVDLNDAMRQAIKDACESLPVYEGGWY